MKKYTWNTTQNISPCIGLFWKDFPICFPSETWTHPPTSIVISDFWNIFTLQNLPEGGVEFTVISQFACNFLKVTKLFGSFRIIVADNVSGASLKNERHVSRLAFGRERETVK